jgi:hypothetical protein
MAGINHFIEIPNSFAIPNLPTDFHKGNLNKNHDRLNNLMSLDRGFSGSWYGSRG